jgi:hypothetical protein
VEARISPREARRALTRLIGDKPFRETNETVEWRIEVRSSDGKQVAVRVPINLHRKDRIAKPALNAIADRLRIDRKDIADVLANWKPEQLREHLEAFTEDELKEPAMQRWRN